MKCMLSQIGRSSQPAYDTCKLIQLNPPKSPYLPKFTEYLPKIPPHAGSLPVELIHARLATGDDFYWPQLANLGVSIHARLATGDYGGDNCNVVC